MTNVDMTKIPRLAERQNAEKLYLASAEAGAAAAKAEAEYDEAIYEKFQPRFHALSVKHRTERNELRDRHFHEEQALRDERNNELGGGEFAALQAAYELAEKAYQDIPEIVVTTTNDDGDEVPLRCALSKVVILEDDETLKDEDTDEEVLRCLVLPPRPSDEVEDDETENEEAA